MTAIELEVKKAHIIRMIFNTEDEAILTKIENLLSLDAAREKEEDVCLYSPEVLREAVLESEEDIRQGRLHTIEEMRNMHPRL